MIPYYFLTGTIAILSLTSESIRGIFARNRAAEVAQRTPRLAFDRSGSTRTKDHAWTLFDYFAIIILTAFSALRFEVGTDYIMYARRFAMLHPGQWAEQIADSPQEIGYTLLALTLRSVSESPSIMFWVTSALTVIPVYITIKKQSADPTLSILLYILLAFFVAPFNIMRQGVAVSLSFWASTFVDKNKPVFFAINAVAACFHISAVLVALIHLFARNLIPTPKKGITMGIVAVIAAAGISQWSFLGSLLNSLNDRYDGYLVGDAAGLGTYLVILSRIALLIYALHLGLSEYSNRYGTYVLIGLAFLIIGTQSIAVSRMELYFGIFLILLIPNQLKNHPNTGMHKAIIISFGVVYLAQYLMNWGDLVPYKTYL